ncbi:unnamed protein product [Prorocentrum cordatum]|uniref:Ion transport domain-containing protein n=1 Tax=Prorocentrum cordatum TaxID=2364126 RepID=A0ABN9UKF1_9DINO|nr:unnamed protein product [Polarella glacialis]
MAEAAARPSGDLLPAREVTPCRLASYHRDDMYLAARNPAEDEEFDRHQGPWIHSDQGQMVFGVSIVLNALVIGLHVEAELIWGSKSTVVLGLYFIQCGFVFAFVVEMSLHLLADGLTGFLWKPVRTLRGVQDAFRWDNFFDICVVLIGVVDLWVIAPLTRIANDQSTDGLDAMTVFRILQLLRLVRIVRLLKVSKDLQLLVAGFTRALRSVFWIFVLLLVVIYIGALICAAMLGNNEDPTLSGYFSSVWVSMYSHFKLMTLEAWPDINDAAMEHSSALWVLYFVVYIIITNMALLNLVIGLIMDGVVQNAKTGDEDGDVLKAIEAQPFQGLLRDQVVRRIGACTETFCQQCDQPHLFLTREQFMQVLPDPLFQQLLSIYGIELQVPPDKAFDLLDMHQAGVVSVEELSSALLRLRGSRDHAHPLTVQADLAVQMRGFDDKVTSCIAHLCDDYKGKVHLVEQSLARGLHRIEQLSEELVSQGAVAHEAEAAPLGSPAEALKVPLEDKYVLALLHQAASRTRCAIAALERAESALQQSRAREDALERQVALLERSRWTQTQGDSGGCGPALARADDATTCAAPKAGPARACAVVAAPPDRGPKPAGSESGSAPDSAGPPLPPPLEPPPSAVVAHAPAHAEGGT